MGRSLFHSTAASYTVHDRHYSEYPTSRNHFGRGEDLHFCSASGVSISNTTILLTFKNNRSFAEFNIFQRNTLSLHQDTGETRCHRQWRVTCEDTPSSGHLNVLYANYTTWKIVTRYDMAPSDGSRNSTTCNRNIHSSDTRRSCHTRIM